LKVLGGNQIHPGIFENKKYNFPPRAILPYLVVPACADNKPTEIDRLLNL
jgi:hypothetical protein